MIEHRYHWTDDTVFALSIDRWEEIIGTAVKSIQQEYLFELQVQAFGSWAILKHAHGLKSNWKDFLKAHGLATPEKKMSDAEKASIIQRAIDNANNIIQFDTKRTERMNSKPDPMETLP
jgi:hypothetical protein